jgi:hypothetical protein
MLDSYSGRVYYSEGGLLGLSLRSNPESSLSYTGHFQEQGWSLECHTEGSKMSLHCYRKDILDLCKKSSKGLLNLCHKQ